MSIILTMIIVISPATAIYCYECDSATNFSCSEFWDPTLPVTKQYLTDCSRVYNAQYCIKMSGVFEGKLGTKRFCSSKTWGDYCEYIKRPGDIQEYRSCVFSCSTNACNLGTMGVAQADFRLLAVLSSALVLLMKWQLN